MIGGGGRIGKPPAGVTAPPADQSETAGAAKESAAAAPSTGSAAPKASDGFEKVPARGGMGQLTGANLGRDGGADLLRLGRDNPAAASRIAEGLLAQAKSTLSEIESEMAAAKNLLQSLAAERFSKSARDKMAEELKRKRDKLAGLKLRYHTGMRKMALLQQIAGRLGKPDIEQELDRVLSRHAKLKTDWGRRYHLLSLGELLFGADADTPEHLQEVIRADVRAGGRGEEVGDALHEISPRRIIGELIARTLDGSSPGEPSHHGVALRGELGRSLQGYAMLSELFEKSFGSDPLDKG